MRASQMRLELEKKLRWSEGIEGKDRMNMDELEQERSNTK